MKSPLLAPSLSLALLAGAVHAEGEGEGDPLGSGLAPAAEDDSRWLDLDAELEGLAGGLQGTTAPWMQVGALVRTLWGYSEDNIGGAGGTLPDVSGFLFEDVDVFLEVERDGYFVRVNIDFDSGTTGVLEDGYVRFSLPDDSTVAMGSFKPRVVRSALTDPEHLVFRERTLLGSLFDRWDTGVEYVTGEEPSKTTISVMNASTGRQSSHAWTLRYDFSAYEEQLSDAEGARGAPNYLRMMIGAVYRIDDTINGDADLWGADLAMTMGDWSLHAEYAKLGDRVTGPAVLFNNQNLTLGPDANIWSVTYCQMVAPQWQMAGRWQQPDDTLDTKTWGVALNWFPTDGPVTFVGDATYFESDGPEGWIFSVGANFGSTRPAARSRAGR